TSMTLDTSTSISGKGSMVTFTASVGNPASTTNIPSGTVTFSDGATVLGTVQTRGLVNGKTQAQLPTNSLAMGRHTITATFDGNGAFAKSSAELTEHVTVNLGSLPKLPSGAYRIRDLAGAYF